MNTLSKGTYVISDPCYVIGRSSHSDWVDFLHRHDFFMSEFSKKDIYSEGNHKFAAFHTAYGDGEYIDNHGRKYFVDAGMIGIFPKEMVEDFTHLGDYLHEVSFDSDFVVSHNNGELTFGNVVIDTNGPTH